MVTSKKSVVGWVIVILIVVIGLFVWSSANDPYKEIKKAWRNAGVLCIQEGVTQLAQHIHPHLTITVNGAQETIPEDIGILGGCTAEIHTHDTTGQIHVESPRAHEQFTLGQFFTVWGKPITRPGYDVIVGATGVTTPEFSGYLEAENFYNSIVFKDNQEIKIEYTTKK